MLKERENIIIAADDFGASEKANQRILELARLGKIDRVAVLADGHFSPDKVANLTNLGVKIDVHLDLFGGKEEKGKSAVARIIKFLLHWLSAQGRAKKVEAEWRRQIEKVREIFGKNPDGLNSHQHVYYFPPYFKIAVKLAQECNVSYLRFGQQLVSKKKSPVYIILKFLRIFNRKVFPKNKLETSDYLTSLDWLKESENLLDIYSKRGIIELVCHPERDEEFEIIKNL